MVFKLNTTVACVLGFGVALLFGAAVAVETPGGRTVHHSADFGWTANQDVTEQFTTLLADGTLKAGEELVLGNRNTLLNLTVNCEGEPTRITAKKRSAKFFKGKGSPVCGAPVHC